MSTSSKKRSIAVVTACSNANGAPDFGLTVVRATTEEIAEGIHYDLAAAELLENGYETPLLHFDEIEAPAFLHPAVRNYLGLPPATPELATLNFPEKQL